MASGQRRVDKSTSETTEKQSRSEQRLRPKWVGGRQTHMRGRHHWRWLPLGRQHPRWPPCSGSFPSESESGVECCFAALRRRLRTVREGSPLASISVRPPLLTVTQHALAMRRRGKAPKRPISECCWSEFRVTGTERRRVQAASELRSEQLSMTALRGVRRTFAS